MPTSRIPLIVTLLLLGLIVVLTGREQRRRPPEPPLPDRPRLGLVFRSHRPWLLWEGPQPAVVRFEMESEARREVIGVASTPARRQVLELRGWLGSGAVRLRAHSQPAGAVAVLDLGAGDVVGYLDLLAEKVLAGDRDRSWRTLGNFASLYFASDVGELETKRRLQELLVLEGPLAGPGGAAWLWGEAFRPRRSTALPGARVEEATELEGRHLAPGEGGSVHFELPPVPSGSRVELAAVVEVGSTTAREYHLVAELESGFRLVLAPGPEGGECYQRFDARALRARPGGELGCGVRLTLEASTGGEGLAASIASLALRYLPPAGEVPGELP